MLNDKNGRVWSFNHLLQQCRSRRSVGHQTIELEKPSATLNSPPGRAYCPAQLKDHWRPHMSKMEEERMPIAPSDLSTSQRSTLDRLNQAETSLSKVIDSFLRDSGLVGIALHKLTLAAVEEGSAQPMQPAPGASRLANYPAGGRCYCKDSDSGWYCC